MKRDEQIKLYLQDYATESNLTPEETIQHLISYLSEPMKLELAEEPDYYKAWVALQLLRGYDLELRTKYLEYCEVLPFENLEQLNTKWTKIVDAFRYKDMILRFLTNKIKDKKVNEKNASVIRDWHDKELSAEDINELFATMDKKLKKLLRNYPYDYMVDLYVIGGAAAILMTNDRDATTDIDAYWNNQEVVRTVINQVGDEFGLGHTWCNDSYFHYSDSLTNIATDFKVYKEYNRLRILTPKYPLFMVMKLKSFRKHKSTDLIDLNAIFEELREMGVSITKDYIIETLAHYNITLDDLNDDARRFIEEEMYDTERIMQTIQEFSDENKK